MHPTCPVCSAAMDGPGKTCQSCGAVRYFYLIFFPRFSLRQKYVVIVTKGEKEAVYFFNFKGEDELNEWKENFCTLLSHSFYLSSSFSILAHVVPGPCTVYGALQSTMFFTSTILLLNLLPAILSC